MALRLEQWVRTGELDNTQLGWTIGWLDLEGLPARLQLKLAGNCQPELAGWKVRIHRLEPELEQDVDGSAPPDFRGLNRHRSGHVGDMTTDQMIKHFDIPTDELTGRLLAGERPPFAWRKCLYLEWFSNHNGRVVTQSAQLEVERIGERAFELTEEQWHEQHHQNQQEMEYFATRLGDALDNGGMEEDGA